MIQKIELLPGIFEIQTEFRGNRFRAFLLETSHGYVLIDTCMEDDTKEFLSVIMPLNIAMIILTHHHRDHTGALPGIVAKMPEVTIAAHSLEIDKIPVPVTQTLEHGDLVAGILRVIHVPGHSAGNIALYYEKERILFTGDSVFGAGGYRGVLSSPPRVYSEDVIKARDSIERLLSYPFEKAFLSHGDHLLVNAQEQIRALLYKAPPEE